MAWVATAIVGGSVVSGYMGNKAADKSARASEAAQRTATAEQARQFDIQREDTAPYREVGVNALNQLYQGAGAMGDKLPNYTAAPEFNFDISQLESSPAYQFQLEQGMNAVNRGAAKGGTLGSGNRLLELQRMGQGLAAQGYADEFARQFSVNQDRYNRGLTDYNVGYQKNQDMYGRGQNYLNRLASMAGIGQTAVGQSAAAWANMANAVGGYAMGNAANQANAAAMRYGGIGNAMASGLNNYMTYQYMKPSSNPYGTVSGDAYMPAYQPR